ncbi:MAG: DsrE family protein [Ignavibacteria bacterium]|nr:DsrE family protein [Ignavibacteria bacterium]
MKRLLLLLTLVTGMGVTAFGQGSDYMVVFDLTNPDPAFQERVVRWIEVISESNPDAKIEVVMYGKGFELVMDGKSAVSEGIEKAIQNPNVSFRVCAMAMAKHEVTLDMFFDGVQSVPDGIQELVTKQQQGWGYIKVAL